MKRPIRLLVAGKPAGWFAEHMKVACASRGIDLTHCRAADLLSTHTSDGVTITVNGQSIFDFDIIHLFTVQQNRTLWYAAATEAAKRGVIILDENCIGTSLGEYSILHKFIQQSELGLPFPATTLVSSFREAKRVLQTSPWPIVVKTLNSRRGRGVGLIRNWFDAAFFLFKNRTNSSFSFREYIEADGDYRITVIDGKAYVAVLRRAQGKEWRNNVSLGGVGENIPLETIPEVIQISEKAAQAFHFDLAGVDIIVSKTGKPYILEINRSPELDYFQELSGVNLIEKVVDMYVRKAAAKV